MRISDLISKLKNVTRKQKCINLLYTYSDEINKFLSRCVMYSKYEDVDQPRHNLHQQLVLNYDWCIDMIATLLNCVNTSEYVRNAHLKEQDYRILFSAFGTTLQDAECNITLQQVADLNSYEERYPQDIILDIHMYANMYAASSLVTEKFSTLISTENDYTKEDIINELHKLLDPLLK